MNSAERIRLDRKHLWHPFTPHAQWMDPSFEPLAIASGDGAWLVATDGKRYLDGNSSIWTNLHGHRNPIIDQSIRTQLDKIAHSSFLGLTHEEAAIPWSWMTVISKARTTLYAYAPAKAIKLP